METFYFEISDDFEFIDDLFEEMNLWSLIKNHEPSQNGWTWFETKPIGWRTYEQILDVLEAEGVGYLELQ